MKKLVITIFVAILSIGICFVCNIYVVNSANESEKYLNNITTCLEKSNYKEALQQASNFEEFWQDKTYILSMILHHEILDEIEKSIMLIKTFLNQNAISESDLYEEITCVSTKIKKLRESEILSLENIL